MNRRQFLECAAVLVGGVAVSQLGFSLNTEQMAYLATAPDYISQSKQFFSKAQRRLVTAIAETIIPRTDTPGATDAGVPRFIELMVADWLNDSERKIFMDGLKNLTAEVKVQHGAAFETLSPDVCQKILETMETAASKSTWYQMGKSQRAFISDSPFICQIKELTVWGYFTSEVGATKALRYNPMPMRFDGDVPLASKEGSWATYRV